MAASVISVFGVFAVVALYRVATTLPPVHPDLAYISRMSGVHFPPGSRLLRSQCNKLNQELYAKVQIRPAELHHFLSLLPSGSQVSRTERVDNLDRLDGPAWWQPGSPGRFVSIYTQPPDSAPVNALISPDGSRQILYLYRIR